MTFEFFKFFCLNKKYAREYVLTQEGVTWLLFSAKLVIVVFLHCMPFGSPFYYSILDDFSLPISDSCFPPSHFQILVSLLHILLWVEFYHVFFCLNLSSSLLFYTHFCIYCQLSCVVDFEDCSGAWRFSSCWDTQWSNSQVEKSFYILHFVRLCPDSLVVFYIKKIERSFWPLSCVMET